MMLTEEAAREKFCPMQMPAWTPEQNPPACQGSMCAAWRWKPEWRGSKSGSEDVMSHENAVRIYERGFCGLAGRPE
jgi:hypothetical protein